ncbi:PREDICTED: olfactory receptor 493-like [Crocodylus porosus]|uniref:olfactory receptor 493-like n=1 Tax=Crocodylus porosus TaxID=8502 RepID=UPI0009396C25|nr:PREDICTED: olfactory receptor 493-like [Crocodylus porosus]
MRRCHRVIGFLLHNEIDHFFCDFSPLLKLACYDTYLFEMVALFFSFALTLVPFLLTTVSYNYILEAILKVPSTAGLQKAISTCSSPLIVVTMLYGTLIKMYVVPAANHSLDLNKILSVFYIIVTLMVSSFIYSLRSREIQETLKRMIYDPDALFWGDPKPSN